MSKQYFISGIGTDVGKTLASAILCHRLGASYWKPIQSGSENDSRQINSWLGNSVKIYPESFILSKPLSPHIAAEYDNVHISEDKLLKPTCEEDLIVEGAGGLMVPLNRKGLLMADLVKEWNMQLIIVVRHYLGSINHTLLTLQYCREKKMNLAGLIFNGKDDFDNEKIILQHFPLPVLLRIPVLDKITQVEIEKLSAEVQL